MRLATNLLDILTNSRAAFASQQLFHRLVRQSTRRIPGATGRRLESRLQELGALEFVRRWFDDERVSRHSGRWVVNSFLPPFPGQAYDRMFENLLMGERIRPLSAFLALTTDCPADCWHCSIKNRRPGQPLDRQQWLDVIAQLHGLGTSLIGLTGGEPLTREDLPDLVDAVHKGGAEAELFTSGIGATRMKINALRDAGLWAVGVSLDHTDPETVNRMRRTPEAFDAAIATLEMSHRAGLYTFINAVADRNAVASGEYRRLYDLARRLKLHELRLIEPMPCGRLAEKGHDCFLEPEQVAELRRFHRETNRRGRGPKVCAFNQIESPELFGCGAGTLHLFIDPSGEVCPCDFTPMSFGNVVDECLDVIWQRMADAMRQPRRHCFIQTNAELIQRHAQGQGFPLPPEASLRVAAEAPEESLPDYFQVVTKPFGVPQQLGGKKADGQDL